METYLFFYEFSAFTVLVACQEGHVDWMLQTSASKHLGIIGIASCGAPDFQLFNFWLLQSHTTSESLDILDYMWLPSQKNIQAL